MHRRTRRCYCTVLAKDLVQPQGHDEWLKVIAIDLLVPGIRAKALGGEPKSHVIGVAKLSGAWVKRSSSPYMFQLPRESAEWGKFSNPRITKLMQLYVGIERLMDLVNEYGEENERRDVQDDATQKLVAFLESAVMNPPKLELMTLNTTELTLGWCNGAVLSTLHEKLASSDLNIEMIWIVQVEDGTGNALSSHYREIYRGQEGGCWLNHLKSNTSYRFRLQCECELRCNETEPNERWTRLKNLKPSFSSAQFTTLPGTYCTMYVGRSSCC